MPTTKAQQKAVNKYIKNNYDRISVTVPKGLKKMIETHAKTKGESVNAYINALICEDMGMSEEEWKRAGE